MSEQRDVNIKMNWLNSSMLGDVIDLEDDQRIDEGLMDDSTEELTFPAPAHASQVTVAIPGLSDPVYVDVPAQEPVPAHITEEIPVTPVSPFALPRRSDVALPQPPLSSARHEAEIDTSPKERMLPGARASRLAGWVSKIVNPQRTARLSSNASSGQICRSLHDPLQGLTEELQPQVIRTPMFPLAELPSALSMESASGSNVALDNPLVVRNADTSHRALPVLARPTLEAVHHDNQIEIARRRKDVELRVAQIEAVRIRELHANPVINPLERNNEFFQAFTEIITNGAAERSKSVASLGDITPVYKRDDYWYNSGQVLLNAILQDGVPGTSEPVKSNIRNTLRMKCIELGLSRQTNPRLNTVIDSENGWRILQDTIETLCRGASNESLRSIFTNIHIRIDGTAEHKHPFHTDLPLMKRDVDNLAVSLGLDATHVFDRNQQTEFGFNLSTDPNKTDALDKILERIGGVSSKRIINLDALGLGSFAALVPSTGTEQFNTEAEIGRETGGFVVLVHPVSFSCYMPFDQAKHTDEDELKINYRNSRPVQTGTEKGTYSPNISVWQLTYQGYNKVQNLFNIFAKHDFVDPRPDVAYCRESFTSNLSSRLIQSSEVKKSEARMSGYYNGVSQVISGRSKEALDVGNFVLNVKGIIREAKSLVDVLNNDEMDPEIRNEVLGIIENAFPQKESELLDSSGQGAANNDTPMALYAGEAVLDAEIVSDTEDDSPRSVQLRINHTFDPPVVTESKTGNGHHY